MKDKITKQTVESLKPGAKDRTLWDTELPMFGCKITPKGRRVYLLQYRINGTTEALYHRHAWDFDRQGSPQPCQEPAA